MCRVSDRPAAIPIQRERMVQADIRESLIVGAMSGSGGSSGAGPYRRSSSGRWSNQWFHSVIAYSTASKLHRSPLGRITSARQLYHEGLPTLISANCTQKAHPRRQRHRT